MKTNNVKVYTFALMVFVFVAFASQVFGDPTGATISSNTTDTGPTTVADGNITPRGTITTMVLDSTQQDQFWKGYVGNVTGTLSLDDASSNTIYDWTLATITGEVYATRAASLDFGSVQCAQTATIAAENTLYDMTQGQIDNINGTFNATGHSGFVTAGVTITADTCPSQSLFESDTRQPSNSSANFQEILLEDNAGSIMYTAIINDDVAGFDGAIKDFQLIVPESNINATAKTYYFYLELG